MPIVHMISKSEEAPAGAVNLRNVTDLWKSHSTYPEFSLWLYDSHVGLCLFEREANFYDDSDFYMTVWNAEKGEPEEICFGTTRGWSYPTLASKVDATPEVRAAYDAWKALQDERERKAREARLAATPAKGKTLRVIAGRKVPKGTVGLCFWAGVKQYGYRDWSKKLRVGLELADGSRVFTDATNVEVVA